MGDVRFRRVTVVSRKPHPCWWCPDEIHVGVECESWVVTRGALLVTGWAHPVCEDDMCDKLSESFGSADETVREPDRESMPRTLSFMGSEEDVKLYVACDPHEHEAERLTALWRSTFDRYRPKVNANPLPVGHP